MIIITNVMFIISIVMIIIIHHLLRHDDHCHDVFCHHEDHCHDVPSHPFHGYEHLHALLHDCDEDNLHEQGE